MKKIRILALVLALLLTASLAACAAKSSAPMAYDNTASAADNYKTEAASEEMPAEAPMMAEPESEWTENSITTQSYDEQSNATNEATDDAPTESLADKMIYSANLEIQTTEYDAAVAALEKAVQDFGGFVERSNTYGDIRRNDDGTSQVVNRYADYTVRIPASRFSEFLTQADGLGNVLSCNRYAENVTSQYTDYEARLSSCAHRRNACSACSKSPTMWTASLPSRSGLRMCAMRRSRSSAISAIWTARSPYSTVSVGLQEVEIYTPTKPVQRTFGEKMHDALSEGWSSFVRSLQYFLIDLTYSLPGLILFVLIVAAVIFVLLCIRRRVKAKKAAKKAAAEAAKQPPEQPDEKN